MKFLVDAQLPPALARALVTAGFDAAHVEDLGLKSAADSVIWAAAQRSGAAILTKDEDFVEGALRFGDPAPIVVWIRFGNVSRQALISRLMPLIPDIVELMKVGEPVIEIR